MRKGGSETRQGLEFSGALARIASPEKFSRPLRARAVLGEPAGERRTEGCRVHREVDATPCGKRRQPIGYRSVGANGREAKGKPAGFAGRRAGRAGRYAAACWSRGLMRAKSPWT